MIKAIFFDAAGILYTRSGHTEEFAFKLLQQMGFPTEISPEELQEQLALRSKANEGLVSHELYWDKFLLLRGVADPGQRVEFSRQIINYSNDIQPVPGAREALSHLKDLGLILGIITDTMYPIEWKIRRLEKAGVAEFIDVVVCSTDIGAHKPDPAVYSYAFQRTHLSPEETVFVGHLGIELLGAHTAGMVTVGIDHDADAEADFFCRTLMDLLTLPIIKRIQSPLKD